MRLPLDHSSDELSVSLSFGTTFGHLKYFVKTVAYFCPHCGTECYGAAMYPKADIVNNGGFRFVNDRIKEVDEAFARYQAQIGSFLATDRCPACLGKLSKEQGYTVIKETESSSDTYTVSHYELDHLFEQMKTLREEKAAEQAKKEAAAIKNRGETANQIADSLSGEGLDIAANPKALLPYIGHLMRLETGIYSLEQHLTELLQNKILVGEVFFGSKGDALQEVLEAEDELNELDYNLSLRMEKLPKPKAEYAPEPQKPIFEQKKPQEPIYEQPGLFNKKKVFAENEAKKAEFQAATAKYEQNYADFQAALKQYEADWECWKADCAAKDQAAERKLMEKECGPYLRKVKEACGKIDKISASWALFGDDPLAAQVQDLPYHEAMDAAFARTEVLREEIFALNWNPEENAGFAMITEEIANSEKLMGELIGAKNKLYSLNVIHPKYRNPVAISAFYDYLMTGRCAVLTGADGAYNLFEAENKTRQIMDKITDITASLDELRENQGYLYQQVTEANNGIQLLNQSMNKVVKGLAKINRKADQMAGHLSSLDEKTTQIEASVASVAETAEMAAHYSQISAFYAKRNAELTDALGYLVAFK